jgi:hypothetical protein
MKLASRIRAEAGLVLAPSVAARACEAFLSESKVPANSEDFVSDLKPRYDRGLFATQSGNQASAIGFLFRRNQPNMPLAAKIRPGSPPPRMGPGTGESVPRV